MRIADAFAPTRAGLKARPYDGEVSGSPTRPRLTAEAPAVRRSLARGRKARPYAEPVRSGLALTRLWCAVWGHDIDNRAFREHGRSCLRCGASILAEDGSRTHVGHTFSCFLRHHTYVKGGTRDGHNEYVCVRCGHPLLFGSGSDRYESADGFVKRVRYLCGLFGHQVHTVTRREGLTEYACHCGHSFLGSPVSRGRVTHPWVCVLFGHFVRFVEPRYGQSEFLCENCGHTFFFADRPSGARPVCP